MRCGFVIWTCAISCCAQPAEIVRWADHWAGVYQVERELVHAVIEVESGWNASAVSPKGAAGIMQLMPRTAAAFRVRNRFDVEENIRGGVAYLAWLREVFGDDRRLVIAGYIAGAGAVLRRGSTITYSAEVQDYVARVAYLYRRNRWEKLLREGVRR